MIRNRSSTSVTSSVSRWLALLLVLLLAGVLLRSLRLDWQPLWWDEGISVYFATEPLPRMVQLTANDIHPPLYYALLHGWLTLFDRAAPTVARLFSVLIGVLTLPLFALLARVLYPGRPRLVLLAVLLLALNPMHLFYSQEVRMYVLAMALGIVSTAFFWLLLQRIAPPTDAAPSDARGPRDLPLWLLWSGYVLSVALALYTIYYIAFLFVAHLIWALWRGRRQKMGGQTQWPLLAAYGAAGALYLPWLLYTGGKLAQYVDDKVAADNDTPLGLLAYAYRHALAFTAGHLTPPNLPAQIVLHLGLVAALALCLAALYRMRKAGPAYISDPTAALWLFVLVPGAIGYVLNRNLPFFPDGGERLLLFMLPYALLLLADAVDRLWIGRVGRPALVALLLCAVVGIATFYRLPRYEERDYRPIVAEMVQRGRDSDTMLALFPWQVGYWRAYAPFPLAIGANQADIPGPHPLLVGQGSLEWGPQIVEQIDEALSRGTLWFPAPLALGSDLPLQIEAHLLEQTHSSESSVATAGAPALVNLEMRWVNPTTRLSAWSLAPTPALHGVDADFDAVQLAQSGVAPHPAASANAPLHVALAWTRDLASASDQGAQFDVSLLLQDAQDRVWAARDYRQPTPWREGEYVEHVGILVPVGLPPGPYQVLLRMRPVADPVAVDGEAPPTADISMDDTGSEPLSAILADGQVERTVPVASLQVTPPAAALSPHRLPIQHPLDPPHVVDGLALWGYAGYDGAPWLAGAEVNLTLFFQGQADTEDRHVYVSLLDENGAGVAGWAGWPLPNYTTATWRPGALVRVPVQFYLPATLAGGRYRLIAGLLDPASQAKSPPATLDTVTVQQRDAQFEPPEIQAAVEPPVQFGTHVELVGYDWQLDESIRRAGSDAIFALRLHWRVLQPLLPPHHIFVHADAEDATGAITTLVQDDGPPRIATDEGVAPAPTGSWQPGEYLTTVHRLTLPADVRVDPQTGLLSAQGMVYPWRVGLYDPATGVRLPATVNGQPRGDYVELVSP
jgi:hypothetical protein